MRDGAVEEVVAGEARKRPDEQTIDLIRTLDRDPTNILVALGLGPLRIVESREYPAPLTVRPGGETNRTISTWQDRVRVGTA
jgi:hypothetical protein